MLSQVLLSFPSWSVISELARRGLMGLQLSDGRLSSLTPACQNPIESFLISGSVPHPSGEFLPRRSNSTLPVCAQMEFLVALFKSRMTPPFFRKTTSLSFSQINPTDARLRLTSVICIIMRDFVPSFMRTFRCVFHLCCLISDPLRPRISVPRWSLGCPELGTPGTGFRA